MSSTFTISAKNLAKRFNREWIFRDLDYEFERGKIYAITGPNGSGKSTLMQTLWGQLPQTAGTVEYTKDGHLITQEEVFRHVTIAAPYMDLIDEFTLQEHLKFQNSMKPLHPGLSIPSVLEILQLANAADKPVGNFSSGVRQRIRLALAFFTASDVLFLDEPGSNLDKRAFEWYRSQLELMSPLRITFIASNNPDEYPAGAETINITDYKQAAGQRR